MEPSKVKDGPSLEGGRRLEHTCIPQSILVYGNTEVQLLMNPSLLQPDKQLILRWCCYGIFGSL